MEEQETRVILKDGTRVSMRSVEVCDKKCIQDGFDQLSSRSRYSRYHTPMKRLPETYLNGLTSADDLNDVVIVTHLTEKKPNNGLGLARYVCIAGEDRVAEFSITVIDEYQNQGLGAYLLEYLVEHARHNQIAMLRGYVLPSNEPMISLLKRYHFKRGSLGEGTYCYEIDLTNDSHFSSGLEIQFTPV